MIPGTNENAAKYPASDSQDTRRPVRFNLNSFARNLYSQRNKLLKSLNL